MLMLFSITCSIFIIDTFFWGICITIEFVWGRHFYPLENNQFHCLHGQKISIGMRLMGLILAFSLFTLDSFLIEVLMYLWKLK